ncbi:MAG TPA: RDD family protein [archaeon]|nr:RDD family protein [archaeon]
MENVIINSNRAGFWIRLAALWIDAFIIYSITHILVFCGALIPMYISFWQAVLALSIIYFVILHGWRAQTVGKMICGLRLMTKGKTHAVGYLRSFLREVIGKLTIGIVVPITAGRIFFPDVKWPIALDCLAVFLVLFVLLIHYLITKRAWYDVIARTAVLRESQYQANRARAAFSIALAVSVVFIGIKVGRYASTGNISTIDFVPPPQCQNY